MEQKIRRDRNMGDNLRRLRGDAGLSQEKLCAELQRRGCDIGRTTYAKYEAGELNIRIEFCLENTLVIANTLFRHTREDSTHGHHQMVNTKIRLIVFFAAKDGEALCGCCF